MFLWKNAVVLCVLLAMVTWPASMLARGYWERVYIGRLAVSGALIACLAISFLPMLWTQLAFALLMLACFDKRVPMAATYLFFFFWTPAAGSLLGIFGIYIAPLTPFMAYSGALLIGYFAYRGHHQRRGMVASDAYIVAFLVIYCICVSLRAPPTTVARNIATYVVPYMISYFVLSRVRIERPELVLRLMTFGAAAGAMLCMFESFRHWPLYAGLIDVKRDLWIIDAPRAWLERGGVLRAYGPYAHPLTGSAMMGLAGAAAWGLYLARGRRVPVMLLGGLVLLGLASTLSRSGVVALTVGVTAFQYLRGRYLLAGLVPIAGLALVFFLPILGGGDAQYSATYRLSLITGVPGALGNGIWLGHREAVEQGVLAAFIQGQGMVDLVNVYLAILVSGGIVSLVPFVLFLLSTFSQYRAIRRMKPDGDQLILAQALVSIQAALLVALALLSSWVAPMQLSFLVTAMLVALRFEVARERKAEKPVRVPLVATLPVDEGERLPGLR